MIHSPRSDHFGRFAPEVLTPRPEYVREFQKLYVRHRGVTLSSDQALSLLIRLLVIADYKKRNASVQSTEIYPSPQ